MNHQRVVKTFEVWEREFREHPERFLTAEQCARMGEWTLAEQRARIFEAIASQLPPEAAP